MNITGEAWVRNPTTIVKNSQRVYQSFASAEAAPATGTAASGLLLQAFYTVPEQYQQSLGDRCAHCRVLRTLPAFGHSIARRSLDEVPSS